MDFLLLTLASLVAIGVLGAIASKLFPVGAGLDERRVSRNLLRYEPETQIDRVFISTDKQTALVSLHRPEKTFGLLRQMGDRVVCRLIQQTDIDDVSWQGAVVRLSLTDFSQPKVRVTLEKTDVDHVKNLIDSTISFPGATDAT